MIWSTACVHPALTRPARADVAVVGGGLLGAALAHELARRAVPAALVTAGAIGDGTTAHSLGMIVEGLHYHYSVARKALGAHRVPDLWALARRNLQLAEQVVRDESIDCGFVHARIERVAGSDRERDAIAESDALWPRGPEALVDPPAMARGLARAAKKRGALIFENSRVEVEEDGRGLRLGPLRCEMVVHAHNEAMPDLVEYFVRAAEVVDAPGPPRIANYGRDWTRPLPDGRAARVSGRFERGREAQTPRWTLHGLSCDELPNFGPKPGTVRQYVACGAHGSEMSYALVGAHMIADLITTGASDLPYKWFDPRRHQL